MKSTFTAQEVAQIQKLLQEAANEPPESFETEAVIGMLSGEIDTLRRQGMTDDEIASVISQGANATITADEVGRFYAPPEDPGHGPSADQVSSR